MNLDEKTGNGTESGDPANSAASLAQVTLKSPKPGQPGPKQKRARNASDAMGGAAAKDKPGKAKSRKKALNFDDLAQATISIDAAAERAKVVSIIESRNQTEAASPAPAKAPLAPVASAPAAESAPAPIPAVEVPVAEVADLVPSAAADYESEKQADSMNVAAEQAPAELAPTAQTAPETADAAPMQAWEEPRIADAWMSVNDRSAAEPAPMAPPPVAAPAEPAEKPGADDTNGAPRSRFEAIAARAARAQVSKGQPGSAVQAARAAQQEVAERTRQGNDFYSFWAQRKNGRRFPSYGDFDAKQIAELWPNTMLLSCGIIASGNVNFTQVMRLTGTAEAADGAEEVNFTPMLTEWMLAIGREAASAGKPVQDIETFQNIGGSSSYRIVALPLGNEETQVDHVLCNLARA
ncbi:MAG TPA: hypothetical protein VH835_10760 [Dongiaceae bacterium]|jgi:hypothetical protein